ncbi:MAG TPA: Uma2 family endonuclease [Actinocrinis sp.]|nr:Uma2 family endonuclease [Actinocrinis sp.]
MTLMTTTLAEFARDPRKHIELVNGEIIVSPNAAPPHFLVATNLSYIFRKHRLYANVEANLILVDEDWAAGRKALVREPDVYVLREPSRQSFQSAANVLLVAEVVSPGTEKIDWREKMVEYAEAGIPHYWIVDFFEDESAHLYTFREKMGFYTEREHWDGDVDIRVGGVDVRFSVPDLLNWTLD